MNNPEPHTYSEELEQPPVIQASTEESFRVVDSNTQEQDLIVTPEQEEQLRQRSASEVFLNHLRLRSEGKVRLDIVRNYDPNIVIISNWGNFTGHQGVIESATVLSRVLPTRNYFYDGLLIQGNTAFEKWSADGTPDGQDVVVHNGADAFIIRDGKIVAMTIFYVPEPREGVPTDAETEAALGEQEAQNEAIEGQLVDPRRLQAEVILDHLDRCEQDSELDLSRNYDPNVNILSNFGNFTGYEGMRTLSQLMAEQLPARKFHHDELLIQGDVAYVKWSAVGQAPNGSRARVEDGIDAFIMKNGRIVAQTVFYSVTEESVATIPH